jgi:hypothetical protein
VSSLGMAMPVGSSVYDIGSYGVSTKRCCTVPKLSKDLPALRPSLLLAKTLSQEFFSLPTNHVSGGHSLLSSGSLV